MTAVDTRPAGYPETPNLDKMIEVKAQSQPIGEFLEWLQSEGWTTHPGTTETVLASYFGVDQRAADKERDEVYRWMVKRNESRDAETG